MAKSGLEGREPIPRSTVRALERLASRLPISYSCSLTDRLLLTLPWLAEKLTYSEVEQVICWCQTILGWVGEQEKENILEVVNLTSFLESDKIAEVEGLKSDVKLEMETEKKRKKLVRQTRELSKQLREMEKRIKEAKREERKRGNSLYGR